MELDQMWNDLPQDLREILVRVVLALLVLVLVWLTRRLLARLIIAPLRRITERTPMTWDTLLLDTLIVPLRVMIVALGLAAGGQILRVDRDTTLFVDHLARSLLMLAVFIAGWRLVDAFAPSGSRLFQITGITVEERLLPFLRTAFKLVLALWLLIALLGEWGFDASGLLASGGLIALGLSFAAQDTVSNVFGFTAIVSDQPFVVGEFIKTPDVEGIVEQVGLRSTRVRQLDQAYVTVPNSRLAGSAILNWSRLSKRRLNTTLHIVYSARRDQIEALVAGIRAILTQREHVDADSVIVHLVNFGEHAIEVLVICFINLADWRAFTAEKEIIYLEIMNLMESLGLAFAFPSRSVYIESMPGLSLPSTEEKQS